MPAKRAVISSATRILTFLLLVAAPRQGLAESRIILDPNGREVSPQGPRSRSPVEYVREQRPPVELNAAVLGVDARNGFDGRYVLATGSEYESFRSVIESQGIAIVPLISFDSADLAGLDGLILNMRYTNTAPYSDSEIVAVHDFVAHGGGLLAIADGGGGSDVFNFNQLVASFGVVFSQFETDPGGHAITSFISHPVTAGLSIIGVDYQRPLTSIVPPSVDLTSGTGSDDALAAADGTAGSGNVVLISDGSIWLDNDSGSDTPIGFGDNQRLLENVLSYIGPSACVPVLTVSLAPHSLWPPNHKMAHVHAEVQVTDPCDPSPIVKLISVTSNEADDGTGDGDSPNDIQGAALGTEDYDFQLRSERSGSGGERLYIACYEVTDRSGNTAQACDTVVVPHDQSGRGGLVAHGRDVHVVIRGQSYAAVRDIEPQSVELGTDDFVRFAPDDLELTYGDLDGDGFEDAVFSFAASGDALRGLMGQGVDLFAHWRGGDLGFLATLDPDAILAVPGEHSDVQLAASVSPNPARMEVRLHYALSEAGHVRLSIFDVAGREVSRVVDADMPAGHHEARWRAIRAAGATQVYLYRLEALGRTVTGRFVLVR